MAGTWSFVGHLPDAPSGGYGQGESIAVVTNDTGEYVLSLGSNNNSYPMAWLRPQDGASGSLATTTGMGQGIAGVQVDSSTLYRQGVANPMSVAGAPTAPWAWDTTRTVPTGPGYSMSWTVGLDGCIYNISGTTSKPQPTAKFDPVAMTWSTIATFDIPAASGGGYYGADSALACTPDGTLYAFDLSYRYLSGNTPLRYYDGHIFSLAPGASTWVDTGLTLPTPWETRNNYRAVGLGDGTILVAGGNYYEASHTYGNALTVIFDPKAGTFTSGPTVSPAPNYQGYSGIALGNGCVYLTKYGDVYKLPVSTDRPARGYANLKLSATGDGQVLKNWQTGGSLSVDLSLTCSLSVRQRAALPSRPAPARTRVHQIAWDRRWVLTTRKRGQATLTPAGDQHIAADWSVTFPCWFNANHLWKIRAARQWVRFELLSSPDDLRYYVDLDMDGVDAVVKRIARTDPWLVRLDLTPPPPPITADVGDLDVTLNAKPRPDIPHDEPVPTDQWVWTLVDGKMVQVRVSTPSVFPSPRMDYHVTMPGASVDLDIEFGENAVTVAPPGVTTWRMRVDMDRPRVTRSHEAAAQDMSVDLDWRSIPSAWTAEKGTNAFHVDLSLLRLPRLIQTRGIKGEMDVDLDMVGSLYPLAKWRARVDLDMYAKIRLDAKAKAKPEDVVLDYINFRAIRKAMIRPLEWIVWFDWRSRGGLGDTDIFELAPWVLDVELVDKHAAIVTWRHPPRPVEIPHVVYAPTRTDHVVDIDAV